MFVIIVCFLQTIISTIRSTAARAQPQQVQRPAGQFGRPAPSRLRYGRHWGGPTTAATARRGDRWRHLPGAQGRAQQLSDAGCRSPGGHGSRLLFSRSRYLNDAIVHNLCANPFFDSLIWLWLCFATGMARLERRSIRDIPDQTSARSEHPIGRYCEPGKNDSTKNCFYVYNICIFAGYRTIGHVFVIIQQRYKTGNTVNKHFSYYTF